MSTPAILNIIDNNETLVTIYKHWDGDSFGSELYDFLKDMVVVNGFTVDNKKRANGMGCLAAQLIAHFKDGIGDLYIVSNNTRTEDFSYQYKIFVENNKLSIIAYDSDNDRYYTGLINKSFSDWTKGN